MAQYVMSVEKERIRMKVKCVGCSYEWESNPKRPNPRFITCPNCRNNVELRESKLN